MSRQEFHHKLYLLSTVALAASIPLSSFVMGLSLLMLVLNWVAEWNWRTKWERLCNNRKGLLFAAFYLIYAIGLVHTTDWGAAGKEMLDKLPFLFAPIIVITSKPFNHKELQGIFSALIFATLFGCIWNFIYAWTNTLDNYRQMSRFIDHIRFGLCVVVSIVFSFHYFIDNSFEFKEKIRYIYLITNLILIPYLIYSQTLSGIFIIMIVALCYIVHLIANNNNRKTKWLLGGLTGLLLTVSIAYIVYITYDYFHVKDPVPDTSALTASGNAYTFDGERILECGHYVGYYVCEEELATAWPMRSDTVYNEQIAATLIRYLNSLGMRKDSAAVMQLSDEDIRNVEQKTANIYYARKGHIRQALYETFFGFSLYEKYGIIYGSSMVQRVELWRATWRIIRENWFLGVGIGNQRTALARQLELQHSPFAEISPTPGSHNQYLTFWLAAGLIPLSYFCFLLVYPFTCMRKRVTFIYFALILTLALSMLVEDTLDAFSTRMLFTISVPILLFNKTVEH